jgi:hypothetical protein
MITSLRFKREPSGMWDGRLVHEAFFEPVTDLPLSTVCQAANGARERLSRLLGRELTVDVFAPVLLGDGANGVLFGDGTYYAATGALCDAYVVFRERDGHRLAASAFGEEDGSGSGPFSTLEERALARIAAEIAALCVPFTGDIAALRCHSAASSPPPVCVTYFELRIDHPVDAAIGIGLSKDPGLAFGAVVDRSMLADVKLPVRAEFAEARLDARDIARWTVGATVRLETKIGAPATLRVGDVIVAVGECGVRDRAHAVAVTSSSFEEIAR